MYKVAEILAWCEDLESGNRQQTSGALACLPFSGNIPKFCCLGVLCNKLSQNSPSLGHFTDVYDGFIWEETPGIIEKESNLVPEHIIDFLGIPELEKGEDAPLGLYAFQVMGEPGYDILANGESLAEANDSGENFAQIASRIRAAVDEDLKALQKQ